MKYLNALSLGQILAVVIVVHAVAAWFSLGHYHADEHFSILEFAAYKLGYAANLPWEFEAQIRSGFQPFIAWGVANILDIFGVYSPFLLTFILRLLSGLLAVFSFSAFLYVQGDKFSIEVRRYILLAGLLTWVFVFYHVRFSSEAWSICFVLLAVTFYWAGNRKHAFAYWMLSGMALGVAFLARYQMGFIAFGLYVWLLLFDRKAIPLMMLGGLFALSLGALLDYWLYQDFVFPWFNYLNFHLNEIGEDSSQNSMWSYLKDTAFILPPVSLFFVPIIIAFCICFRNHIITYLLVPYILFHFAIANIQIRFLYPVSIFLPFMIAMLWEKWRPLIIHRQKIFASIKFVFKSSFVVNVLCLPYALFFPAGQEIKFIRDCILPLNETQSMLLITRGNMDLSIPFYLGDVEVIQVENEHQLPFIISKNNQKKVLYATRKNRVQQMIEAKLSSQQICSGIPDWVLHLNFNDWVSRASIWKLYSLQ